MEYLDLIKKVSLCDNFVESKNYYYQYHICQKNGENIKIPLNFKISCDLNDNIMLFGVCDDCKTCFYHKDFESSRTF